MHLLIVEHYNHSLSFHSAHLNRSPLDGIAFRGFHEFPMFRNGDDRFNECARFIAGRARKLSVEEPLRSRRRAVEELSRSRRILQ